MELPSKKIKGIVDAGYSHQHLPVANLADVPEHSIVPAERNAHGKLKRGIHYLHEEEESMKRM